MRRVIGCLALLCLVDVAVAADLDDMVIRGSDNWLPEVPTYVRWDGLYGGGQIGYTSANTDLTNSGPAVNALAASGAPALASAVAGLPATFPAFGQQTSHDKNYGFFFGYNWQFESVVLSAEFNYNRTSQLASQSATFPSGVSAPLVVNFNGADYNVTVAGTASSHITDYMTLRGRAGYVIGNFMPYAMIGLAAGRADTVQTATVSAVQTVPPNATLGPFVATSPRSPFIYGYAAGLGVDMALMQHLFIRAEYEFVQFFPYSSGTVAALNTFRLGAGLKF
jgi:opacity protein-like surface antigen